MKNSSLRIRVIKSKIFISSEIDARTFTLLTVLKFFLATQACLSKWFEASNSRRFQTLPYGLRSFAKPEVALQNDASVTSIYPVIEQTDAVSYQSREKCLGSFAAAWMAPFNKTILIPV